MTLTRRFLTALLAMLLAVTTVTTLPARADDSNAASVKAAADWIADTWRNSPNSFSGAGSVADGIIALSAAHPFEEKHHDAHS